MPRICLLLTNRSNLRCKHCFRAKGYNNDMPIDLVEKVLKEGKKMGFRHVSITGGEPFLHKEFDKIIEIITAEKYTFHIVSNGYAFDKFFPLIFKNKYLTCMNFSLDGSNKEVHDRIRGEGSFDKVLESVKLCKENGILFNIVSCINKLNLFDYEKIIDLSKELGAKQISILATLPSEDNLDLVLSNKEIYELYKNVTKLKKNKKIEVKICSSINLFDFFKPCSVYNACDVTLNYDGNLVFCCDLANYSDESCIYPKKWITLGNLKEHSLKDLMKVYRERSKNIQYINCVTNNKRDNLLTRCEVCINSFNKLGEYEEGLGLKEKCEKCIYHLRRKCKVFC